MTKNLNFKKWDKTVFAFYYDWYTAPEMWKGRAFEPLLGKYNSWKKETIHQHLKWTQEAGIDVLVVSWWGNKKWGNKKYAGNNLSSDEVFRRLLEEAATIRSPIKFCIDYETAPTWPSPVEHNPPGVIKDFLHIVKDFGSHPNYFRVEGRPVLVLYNRSMGQLNVPEWKKVIKAVQSTKEKAVLVAEGYNFTNEMVKLFDSFHFYNPCLHGTYGGYRYLVDRCRVEFCQKNGLIPTVTVVPGFDSSQIGRNYVVVDRENGESYRRLWGYAMKSGAPWVFITSFNEWYEGSIIEPSKEFGRLYLDITAEMVHAFKNLPKKEQKRYFMKDAAPGEKYRTIGKIFCQRVGSDPQAPVHNKFYRLNGEPSLSKTSVSLLYDHKNLYIRIICFEPGMKELALTAKDGTDNLFINDDSVEIFIIPDNKSSTPFYQFITTAAGTLFARKHQDATWKGEWKVKVDKEAEFWTVEAIIPFATLNKRPKKEDIWRMNFCRSRVQKGKWPQELSSAFPLFGDYFVPERFGKVEFK